MVKQEALTATDKAYYKIKEKIVTIHMQTGSVIREFERCRSPGYPEIHQGPWMPSVLPKSSNSWMKLACANRPKSWLAATADRAFADRIGADGYGSNTATRSEQAKRFVGAI